MRRAHWGWQDPREAALLPAVSADSLMAHARAIATWERESGSPGEARAFDYIESRLKGYGLEVERRLIEAYISLPLEARVLLPDGTELEALTHSFSTSTAPEGLEAFLVDGGDGTVETLARAGARGKLALVDNFATPAKAWAAQEAGTLGQLFTNLDHLHNMIVTTVWGTPTPETACRIPKLPCCSIKRVDAEALRARLAAGPLRVRLVTRVRTEWMPIPHLTGHLAGAEEDFTLFSGHVDAWHHGAMDNGSANATMLEVARLLSGQRGALRRGLRLAFWSGHSHGRYAGSAWYADHAWRELERHGVIHMNVDSTGARGATDFTVFHATEDAADFAETVVADVTGQRGRARHFSRAGDQSFWGIGLPSAFMSMSQLPPQDTEFGRTTERLFGTSGFPWWWHTREDTIDKLDGDVLAHDTRVFVASALRLCNGPVLPLGPARAARAVADTALELHTAARGRVDLSPLVAAARGLAAALDAVAPGLARLAAGEAGDTAAANRLLMRLSRALVPLLFTGGDRFAHDLALSVPPLASLQRARELPGMAAADDLTKFSLAALGRERNRAHHALDVASELAAELGARVPQGEIR
ncbi:MAG TPA: M28 family peptidase [Methylomirabilota bacterium]